MPTTPLLVGLVALAAVAALVLLGVRRWRRLQRKEKLFWARYALRSAQGRARDELRLWLKDDDPALTAAVAAHLAALDARAVPLADRRDDDAALPADLRALAPHYDAAAELAREAWGMEYDRQMPVSSIQALRHARAADPPARRDRPGTKAATSAEALDRLVERLEELERRREALIARIPSDEIAEARRRVAGLRGEYRALAEPAHTLWAARFPAEAKATGAAMLTGLIESQRRMREARERDTEPPVHGRRDSSAGGYSGGDLLGGLDLSSRPDSRGDE